MGVGADVPTCAEHSGNRNSGHMNIHEYVFLIRPLFSVGQLVNGSPKHQWKKIDITSSDLLIFTVRLTVSLWC